MSISLPCPRSTRSSTPANADGGFVMLTAPLLQHFQIEITYGGAVSGPLTVPFSNRGRNRAGARTLTAGGHRDGYGDQVSTNGAACAGAETARNEVRICHNHHSSG